MNHRDITHPNLNNGTKTRVYYTVHEKEFDVFFREIYDEEHYKKGLDHLFGSVDKKVVVDLGANVGLATLYFVPYAKKIYAFEPSPPVFEALKKNTEKLDNVEVFNEGVLVETKDVEMASRHPLSPPQAVWDGSSNVANLVMAKFYNIQELFQRHNITHVDLLKIDIEGIELEIFPSKEFGNVAKDIDAIIGEGHIIREGELGIKAVPQFIPLMLDEWGYKTEFIKTPNPYFSWKWEFEQPDRKREYTVEIDAIFFAKKS